MRAKELAALARLHLRVRFAVEAELDAKVLVVARTSSATTRASSEDRTHWVMTKPKASNHGMKTSTSKPARTVLVVKGGRPYQGKYSVSGGTLTVSYGISQTRTTQLGNCPAHSLATALLAELIAESTLG